MHHFTPDNGHFLHGRPKAWREAGTTPGPVVPVP
jgi:hypothetical protein